jgi:hypothetical protein
MKLAGMAVTAAVGLALAAPAFAHHSFAMFDAEKTVKVTGTVRQVEWTNPHVWIRIMINNAEGKAEQWGFEMGPPAQQIRRGWEPDSLKPGDTVTLNMHPMKDGSRGGQVVDATLPDGRTVGGAGAPAIR